jgi:hypothetical protein
MGCRHRLQKKLEKQQARLDYLKQAAQEAALSGSEVEAREAAERLKQFQQPWILRNMPVLPPSFASVSGGSSTTPKVAKLTSEDIAERYRSGTSTETRKLDVLNFKVGYALDAQYALPEEV